MEKEYIYNENTPSVTIILTLFEEKCFHKDQAWYKSKNPNTVSLHPKPNLRINKHLSSYHLQMTSKITKQVFLKCNKNTLRLCETHKHYYMNKHL